MKVEVRSPRRKKYEEEYNNYVMEKYNNDQLEGEYFRHWRADKFDNVKTKENFEKLQEYEEQKRIKMETLSK